MLSNFFSFEAAASPLNEILAVKKKKINKK